MPCAPLLSNLCGAGSISRDNLLPCDVFNRLTLTLREWKAGQKTPPVTAVCKKYLKCERYSFPDCKKNGVLHQFQIVRHAFLRITLYFPWLCDPRSPRLRQQSRGQIVQLWCAYLSTRNYMEPLYSFITSFLHAGVVLWDTLIEAVSKVAKYRVHCMLGFMRLLGAGEAVQRDGDFESYPSTGINSI